MSSSIFIFFVYLSKWNKKEKGRREETLGLTRAWPLSFFVLRFRVIARHGSSHVESKFQQAFPQAPPGVSKQHPSRIEGSIAWSSSSLFCFSQLFGHVLCRAGFENFRNGGCSMRKDGIRNTVNSSLRSWVRPIGWISAHCGVNPRGVSNETPAGSSSIIRLNSVFSSSFRFSWVFDVFRFFSHPFSIFESDPHLEKLKATMKDVTTYSVIELRSAYV